MGWTHPATCGSALLSVLTALDCVSVRSPRRPFAHARKVGICTSPLSGQRPPMRIPLHFFGRGHPSSSFSAEGSKGGSYSCGVWAMTLAPRRLQVLQPPRYCSLELRRRLPHFAWARGTTAVKNGEHLDRSYSLGVTNTWAFGRGTTSPRAKK